MFQNKAKHEAKQRIKQLELVVRNNDKLKNQAIEVYRASLADKWEYLMVDDLNPSGLETAGSRGWELVTVAIITTGGGSSAMMTVHSRYVFKRRLTPIPPNVMETITAAHDNSKLLSEIDLLSAEL